MNKRSFRAIAVLLLMGMILAALILTPAFAPQDSLAFAAESAVPLDSGWQLLHADGTSCPVDLPAEVPAQKDQPVTISCTLPAAVQPGASMLIRSSQQSVELQLDGETIYTHGTVRSGYRGSMIGSAWNLVRLPDNSEGKTVTLILTSPYETTAGILNPVMCGSRSALLNYIVQTYKVPFLCAVLVLAVGLALVGLSLLSRGRSAVQGEMFPLGLFAICVGLWLLGESKMLQFFCGSAYLNANLAFFALLLMPIPFTQFIERAYQPHGMRLTPVIFWAYTTNGVLCLLAQILGIADLFVTLPVTHLLIFLGAMLVTVSLVWESVRWNNRDAIHLLVPMSVLLVSGVGEMLTFYRGDLSHLSGWLRVGMMIFIVMLGAGSVQRLVNLLNKNREARYFKQLAYQDLLTGYRNRTAYFEDVQRVFGAGRAAQTRWLVLLDVNCLKNINDRYGHSMGDDALRRAADCMRHTFASVGQIYRIGGDEFALILSGPDETAFSERIDEFFARVERENKEVEYSLQVAAGFGWYDDQQYAGFEEFSQEIDRRMYQNKLRLKSEQNRDEEEANR